MNTPVTRFAPSPTGHLHAGGYRTAFFAYLYARKHGGTFILRIEDTDRERSKQEYTDEILRVFDAIGISYDERYIQSEHVQRHKEVLQQLIAAEKAYVSREEAKDGSGIVKDIIRFRNPGKVVTFDDLIRGPISTDTTDLGDFVIAKNIEEPLFHLAVVVDDHDEGITHVIRAEEHIANTPRQILIHEALGWDVPAYAHLPLVLAPDKTKLSKRKGAVPVIEYLERGYLPEALLNAICLCGWNPGTEQELFTKAELERAFDLSHVQQSGAVFNEEKLSWFNREYIRKLDSAAFFARAEAWLPEDARKDRGMLGKIEHLIRDRIDTFADIKALFDAGEFSYFFQAPSVPPELLRWKDDTVADAKRHLAQVRGILEGLADWTMGGIKEALMPYAEAEGKGSVLWPLRVSLSGREKSPDPFELASILGKETALSRIDAAIG